MWFVPLFVFLSVLAIARAQPRSEHKVGTAADVVVSWLESDIPRERVMGNLWAALPQQAAIPQFQVISNIGWRERFHEHAEVLVAKAKAAICESEQLQKALSVVLERESLAVLPVAAFQATISGQPVWIVHLQWAQKMTAKFKITKEGPVLDEKSVHGLGHVRTYAIAFDSMEVIAFSTCL
jgi:hypothetical protein